MSKFEVPVYLASKSPRRKKLLMQINVPITLLPVDTEEEVHPGEKPGKAVLRIAMEKLEAAEKKADDGIIITADTVVVLDGRIIGKPSDPADAIRILKELSCNTHTVYTGFCVKNSLSGALIHDYVKTRVTFRTLSDEEIVEYVNTGSPLDKAGSYGIQDDYGAVFVEKISGCYYNVVGLPVSKVYSALLSVR